jgi:acyl dehydratase
MGRIKYYWEDLTAGSVRDLGTVTVSADEIKHFAQQFDPQPFHLDEAAGRSSIFGNLCASGWHTCSLAMKLTVENLLTESSSKGSPGVENLRWLKPVYPGDTLRLKHTILESRPLGPPAPTGRRRPGGGMLNHNRA